MSEHDNVKASMAELLRKDVFTPEELSNLTGIGLFVIRSAIYDGDFKANVVNHDIINFTREDALAWLNRREADEGNR